MPRQMFAGSIPVIRSNAQKTGKTACFLCIIYKFKRYCLYILTFFCDKKQVYFDILNYFVPKSVPSFAPTFVPNLRARFS
jgi:hypothetical protein